MKRYAIIALLTYLAFCAEFVLYNFLGAWGKPELMVLLVVFCTLYWGVRHSLVAAFVAGMLKDAFGIEPFGTNLLIYIAAAYLTIFVRRNLYQPGSRFSRAVVAFLVLAGIFAMQFLLQVRSSPVRFNEALVFVFLPQTAVSMLVVTFVFHRLRDIAVRFKL